MQNPGQHFDPQAPACAPQPPARARLGLARGARQVPVEAGCLEPRRLEARSGLVPETGFSLADSGREIRLDEGERRAALFRFARPRAYARKKMVGPPA